MRTEHKRLMYILLANFLLLIFSELAAQTRSEKIKSEVIIDPSDKTNISGFVNICFSYNERMSKTLDIRRSMINLKEAMLKWTKIETQLDKPLPLSSPNIKKMPFIYMAYNGGLELTDPEKKNVREYLSNGGFMVIENVNRTIEVNMSESMFRKVFEGVFIKRVSYVPIRNDHPLYNCFFEFPNGPPRGEESGLQEIYYLEGLFIGDRLAAIYTNKRYVNKWNASSNNDPQLKIGVNMLVYSLIQDGGITKKVQ